MSEHLKENASIRNQIKMLARLAKAVNDDPRTLNNAISAYLNFTPTQYRIFHDEYVRRNNGDDPLEV